MVKVYGYGFRLGYETSLDYIKKQIRNEKFFKGMAKEWLIGYFDGVLKRNDLTPELRKEVLEVKRKLM